MEMQLDVQKLKTLRESRAWSQSHLADVSGISLRTIQRIEKSGKASPESAKSICSAYDIIVTDIIASKNIQADTDSTFSNLIRYKVDGMTIKATAVSFLVAFIIAFLMTN